MKCPAWNAEAAHDTAESISDFEKALVAACSGTRIAMPSRSDVCSWHKMTFERVVPTECYAGGYRGDAKHICLEHTMGFIRGTDSLGNRVQIDGEHPTKVPIAFRLLFQWAANQAARLDSEWATLSSEDRSLRLASIVGHVVGTFIKIHPFLDGNGRTSRIIWSALLHRYGLPSWVAKIKRPGMPYEHLMSLAMHGLNAELTQNILVSIDAEKHPMQHPSELGSAAIPAQAPSP